MPIDPTLLEFVACPKCKGELVVREDPEGFVCQRCKLFYAVEDDIPNFLVDEARPIDEAGAIAR